MYKIIDYYTGKTYEIYGIKFNKFSTRKDAESQLKLIRKKLFEMKGAVNKLMYISKI